MYSQDDAEAKSRFEIWKSDSGNDRFTLSIMTWICLGVLLVGYPAISLIYADDTTSLEILKDDFILMMVLVGTIIFQWGLYAFVHLASYMEGTGLAGLGFQSFRPRVASRLNTAGLYTLYALAFLLGANLILSAMAWVLAQIGMPMPGELAFLIPRDLGGQFVWVLVSFTAGFCEEVMFRGYLLSRLRLMFNTKSWVMPVIASSLAFGICHAYQGIPGLIIITTYGVMFALLYIRTGSIWPGIIAHSLQDLGALFVPH